MLMPAFAVYDMSQAAQRNPGPAPLDLTATGRTMSRRGQSCTLIFGTEKHMEPESQPVPTLVPYYRVSTAKQGKSGLGLEGQQAAVKEYARRIGANILTPYKEVETGKKSDQDR